ncbi:MAG TPA: FAD-binding oxidoreductase [Ktedonobacteraceae bacterium]|jgi:sarcosine oxidase subunit beta|nr:FAD-binding oxidoreductase [Ktedonobacteraceae bacterium]
MHETADVVIIGAGVNGASLAFHLALVGVRKILVLEKQVAASGATGLSSGLVRMHYTNETEARLALSSFTYFRNWDEIVGGDCGFVETGFIRTVSPKNNEKLRSNVAMLQHIGVETYLITPDELRQIAPTIWSEDLELAAYEPHSGYADPTATTLSLLAAARRHGVELRQHVEVQGFLLDGERVTGVRTNKGTIEAGTVVCATGGWTMRLLEQLGLKFPVWNVRHQVAILQRPPEAIEQHMTYIDGILDIYYRPDSPGLTLAGGGATEPGIDPDSFKHNPDEEFVEEVAEKVSRRIPALENASYVDGWSGVFAVSADLHPLLGSVPGYEQLYAIFGCNGTGFKTAPAIGKAMAELITGVQTPTISLTSFRPSRYLEQDPISDPYNYSDRPQEHTAPP